VHKQTCLNISIILFMFLVGMYLVPIACMNFDLSYMPNDLSDNRLNNYFLENGFKWLSGQQRSFWNAPFFYPAPQVMTLSDNHLGTLPIYSLFRFLSFDRETSYQLWMLVLYGLNYFSAVYILNKMKFNVIGVSIGAYFFSFSLPTIQYFGHEQFLSRFIIPFAFYYTLRFMKEGSIKSFIIVCLSVVFQFYCSIYMGYFLTLAVISMMLACVLVFFEDKAVLRALHGTLKTNLMRLSVVLTSAVLLLPLMYPYYMRAKISKKNPWELIEHSLPGISTYFHTGDYSRVWSWLSLAIYGTSSNGGHFIGLLPMLAFIAIPILYFRYRESLSLKTELVVFITILFVTILTLNMNGLTIYKALFLLPGVGSIREVSRIILLDLFLISILLASVISFISFRLKNKSKLVNSIIMTVIVMLFITDQLVVASNIPHYSKLDAQERIQNLKNEILRRDVHPKLFVYLPNDTKTAVNNLDAMLAAQDLNIPTLNGYSGYAPDGWHISTGRSDVCDKLVRWIGLSRYRYSANNNNDLFKDLIIIGADACTRDTGRLPTYTYYQYALPFEAFKVQMSVPASSVAVDINSNKFLLPVTIKNSSNIMWPASAIKMAYRLVAPDGKPITEFDFKNTLPYDVSPGEILPYGPMIETPETPGDYVVEFDLVQENVAWFHEMGPSTVFIKIVVK